MIRNVHSQRAGFTLVEVLVAIGLMILLITATATVSVDTLRNLRQSHLNMSRDELVNQLRALVTSHRAILKSMSQPENAAFFNCVCGKNTCSHMEQTSTGDFLPFSLYDSTGILQSPAFFDEAGVPCDSADPRCAIRVTTTFFAQCKPDLSAANQNPPLTCNGVPADFVVVMYKVDENPMAAAQNSVHFKPLSGPTYIEVSNLLKEPGACP
jgi:type II secretory pathway pseudopilin PulG